MFNRFQLIQKYLKYYLSASNGQGHGMHSPFVFDFITTVLNDTQQYPSYKEMEALRRRLLGDHAKLTIEDLGAGSTTGDSKLRSIASLAKNAAKPAKYSQLLYRMVRKYQPETIIEMGTSLGLTTGYLAAATTRTVITMEGANAIADQAEKNFSELASQNVRLIRGNFDDTLAALLNEIPRIDFAFVDGNHREEPTLRYFQQLISHINNDSVIVLDDIHWSEGMEKAWRKIQSHQAVRCTLDLFFIGIVFFRQEFKEKQHFTIRF